jgi:hypothetical protein
VPKEVVRIKELGKLVDEHNWPVACPARGVIAAGVAVNNQLTFGLGPLDCAGRAGGEI